MPTPVPECPMCHTRASRAGQQPYCIKCGWNRDAAIAALRHSMKMLPVGVVLFSGFTLFMHYVGHFRSPAQLAIFFAAPVVGLCVNYFTVRSQLAKLEAMMTGVGAGSPNRQFGMSSSSGSGFASADATAAGNAVAQGGAVIEPDAQYKALLSVPRPRQIRMVRRGRLSIILVAIVIGFLAAFLSAAMMVPSSRRGSFVTFGTKTWVIAGVLLLILVVPYAMWRAQVRERDLLQIGEIALGRVTRQWYSEGNSSITYEFTDFRGATHRGLANDYTKKLFAGMGVTIFYDSNKPKRQMAYCSTMHEIVL